MDVRPLYRPSYETQPLGNGAPKGPSKAAIEAKLHIAEYLDAALMRALYATDADRETQIMAALDHMTLPERVFLEIEMDERRGSLYSAEYDPLG